MIDVVFLLLVFFMLAARFGQDGTLEMAVVGSGGAYSGPPRLLTLEDTGLRLNGVPLTGDPVAALRPLMAAPDDIVVIRPIAGAPVQALVDLIGTLKAAGMTSVAVIE
jgi:biopolymer transport protein ExbD